MRLTSHVISPDWPAPANVLALSTCRSPGVSAPPWNGLNLGDHVGDDPLAVRANRKWLRDLLPSGSAIQWLDQVHGTSVAAASYDSGVVPAADASFTDHKGIACAVLTADCLPVLFCAQSGQTVAAAHAGWRGLVGGVLEQTVIAMQEDPSQLLAWLGPAIGPQMFEVGSEVREQFLQRASQTRAALDACFVPVHSRPGKFLADIYQLARLLLRAAGVSCIYGGGLCTVSDSQRFYSYRRDGQTGRMASLILINPA